MTDAINRTNGRDAMAYVGETPWHKKGQLLTAGAPLEVWLKEAGMDYTVMDAPLFFHAGDAVAAYPQRKALYRSDTGQALGLVGSGYQVLQPREVLEFQFDVAKQFGFTLETAGVLYDGAKYWALARTGEEARVGGKSSRDVLREYLMIATACDGTMQSTVSDVAIRVVCQNTLAAAMSEKGNRVVKVSHRSKFDPEKVKAELGLGEWKAFIDAANALAKIKVTAQQAQDFVTRLMADPRHTDPESIAKSRPVKTTLELFNGQARGADMKSAAGTAWGLVNAVTEYVDHLAGKSQDARLAQAWFYSGGELKRRAFDEALLLA